MPNKPQQPRALGSLGARFKTTIRLTHAQARAVKLATLILDKPQQDILRAGLIERLEVRACADLAKFSCFNAVIEGVRAPEQAAPVEEPPLAYSLSALQAGRRRPVGSRVSASPQAVFS